jgi:hypothetical protein
MEGVSDARCQALSGVHRTQRGPLALPGMAPIPPTGRQVRLPPEPAWVKVDDGRLLVYHVEGVPGGGVRGILSSLGVQSGE